MTAILCGLLSVLPFFNACGPAFAPLARQISELSSALLPEMGPGPGQPLDQPMPNANKPFDASRTTVELVPYRTRLSKLGHVAGRPVSDVIFAKVRELNVQLGEHDYSKGVLPNLSWKDTEIKLWTQALEPVCTSSVMKTRFPWPNAAATFVETALGRKPATEDQAVIDQINGATATNAEKFEILCFAYLSSLEFVAL